MSNSTNDNINDIDVLNGYYLTYVIENNKILEFEMSRKVWRNFHWDYHESPILIGVIESGLIYIVTETKLNICLIANDTL